MKAIVTNISLSEAEENVVALMTDYGTLVGNWNGSVPDLSSTVHVELEFSPESIVVEPEGVSYLAASLVLGEVLLKGIVESWADGVLYLRVGPSLVQIECMDEHTAGSWLAVRGQELKFFDTNL